MRVVILGTGGHAKALEESLRGLGFDRIVQVGADDESGIAPADGLIVGIGIGIDCGIPRDRIAAFERYGPSRFMRVKHPTAHLSATARLGPGADVGAMAYIGPDVSIGMNVLVNHGCIVAHDCTIGDHTILAAGANLCGRVTLGRACVVGAGATIVQGVELPDETRIPAGTLVVGPADFRKPVRMVRRDGADTIGVSKDTIWRDRFVGD